MKQAQNFRCIRGQMLHLAVCLAIAALGAFLSFPVAAQTAKAGMAIVERAVEAIGGAALIDGIGTLSVTSTGSRSTQYGKINISTRTYIEFPASFRQEVDFGGQKMVMATSPEGAFLLSGDKVQALSDAQRHNLEVTALHNPLVMLKGRSNKLFSADAAGAGRVGDLEVDYVDVFVGNEQLRIAVDRASGRIVQQEFDTRGGSPERQGRMVVSYTDFRRIPYGINIPHQSTGRFDGETAFAIRIENMSVNDKLSERLFLSNGASDADTAPANATRKP